MLWNIGVDGADMMREAPGSDFSQSIGGISRCQGNETRVRSDGDNLKQSRDHRARNSPQAAPLELAALLQNNEQRTNPMRLPRVGIAGAVAGVWLAASALVFAGAPGQARQRHPNPPRESAPASRPARQAPSGQHAVPRARAPQPARPQAAPPARADAPAETRQRHPDDSSIGQAVRRTEPIRRSHGTRIYVPGYYYPYAFTGLGLGYYYYDPFWRGYYGGPYGPYGYDGYYSGYSGYAYAPSYDQDEGEAAVHLKVKPRDASVFVDGYFTGTVDSYDGIFQKLHLQSGPHRIEVRKPGFEPLSFDVNLEPGQTITYEGDLQEIR